MASPPIHPLRRVLLALFRQLVAVYFRDIETLGPAPDAATRGRLFAANHVNGLVDPILVLTLSRPPISPIGKATLWKIPGLSWLLGAAGAVPITRRKDDPRKRAEDNDAVFSKVAAHLASGGNLLIFPEGISHNEPHLVPLHTGAGRMLARANAEGARGLTYQSVGLAWDARDKFRSRALVVFGPVRSVEGNAEGDLPRALTERLTKDLRAVVPGARSWDEYRRHMRIAELFADDAKDDRSHEVTLGQRIDLSRRVAEAEGVLAVKEPELVQEIVATVDAYYDDLERIGTRDEFVARGLDIHTERLVRAALLLALLPLALVGTLIHFVPYQLPRLATRLLRADADVASTYKLGVGLVAFPVWTAAISAAALAALPLRLALAAVLVTLVSPFAALPFIDREGRTAARLALLVPGSRARKLLPSLRKRRVALMLLLERARSLAEAA